MTDNQPPSLPLTRAIAEHLADWDQAHVELAIHGSDDPAEIARAIGAFCRRQLGTEIDHALFYQSSIGAVAGLELADRRRVVLKAHQPDVPLEQLREIVRLRTEVTRACGLAPPVLGGPAPLGNGLGIVEEYVDRGVLRDAHEPEIREALAASLFFIVRTLEPFAGKSPLTSQLLAEPPRDRALWPTPHSRLFDFQATRAGAEDIDAVACAALGRMTGQGRVVLGHADWRAEHVRFEGNRAVIAFDWDSLRKEPEPALVGFSAHAFCADWTRSEHRQAPSLDEARAFVADYEAARGERFTPGERSCCGAAFAYSVAYTARCGHSMGRQERDQPGTFQHLIATHGRGLLEM